MKRTIFFLLLISAVAGSLLVGVGFPQAQPRKASDAVDNAPGQQANQKAADKADDEKVPESWRGTWKVTVAYRDHETGALVSTDITTDEICPGDLIVPDLKIDSLKCWENAGDNHIEVRCGAKQSPSQGCNVFVNTVLESTRTGNTWSGTGSWTVKGVGNCEHISFGEDFVVSGTRLSNDASCFGARSSLVEGFFAHPSLVRFLAEGRNHDNK
jgi:hypothetical protein